MNPNKIIKGKRPTIYQTPGVDYLMHMVTVLSQELSATRDRLDTLERVAAEKSLFSADDIEAFIPDQEALEQRETRRQKFLSNLFSIMEQEAAEISSGDTEDRFKKVINELASD